MDSNLPFKTERQNDLVVQQILKKKARKMKDRLHLIEPIRKNGLPISKNTLCLLIGQVGQGKTYLAENILLPIINIDYPYTDIIQVSKSGGLDKTSNLSRNFSQCRLYGATPYQLESLMASIRADEVIDEYLDKLHQKFQEKGSRTEKNPFIGIDLIFPNDPFKLYGEFPLIAQAIDNYKQSLINEISTFLNNMETYEHPTLVAFVILTQHIVRRRLEGKGRPRHTGVVIDDYSNDAALTRKTHPVTNLILRRRHFKTEFFICVQSYTSLNKDLRRNANDFIIFPNQMETDIEMFWKEMIGKNKLLFFQIYHEATKQSRPRNSRFLAIFQNGGRKQIRMGLEDIVLF